MSIMRSVCSAFFPVFLKCDGAVLMFVSGMPPLLHLRRGSLYAWCRGEGLDYPIWRIDMMRRIKMERS